MRTGGVLTKGRAWVRRLAKVANSRGMCVVSVEVVISRGGEVEVCMTRLSMRTKRSLQWSIFLQLCFIHSNGYRYVDSQIRVRHHLHILPYLAAVCP